jgi:putative endonuclease
MPKDLNRYYYVYIVSSKSQTLYIGVTQNLVRRMCEHRNKLIEGFTNKYNINSLVYFETFQTALDAIAREKYLKGKSRSFKLELIRSTNPAWKDLYIEILH